MSGLIITVPCPTCQVKQTFVETDRTNCLICACGTRLRLNVVDGQGTVEVLDAAPDVAEVPSVVPAKRETKPAKRVAKKVTK